LRDTRVNDAGYWGFKSELSNGERKLFIRDDGSNRVVIDASGNVGIGTTGPTELLTTRGNILIETVSTTADSGSGIYWHSTAAGGHSSASAHAAIYGKRVDVNNGYLRFDTRSGGVTDERARIDSSGRLLVGTTSSYGIADQVQVVSDTGINLHRGSANTGAARLDLSKSRNTVYGSNTIVESGDTLGSIVFRGDDGTDYTTPGGEIKVEVDGTPGANDMPGRLVFSTNPGSPATAPSPRMTIKADGKVGINKTDPGSTLDVAGSINLTSNLTFSTTTTPLIAANAADSVLRFGTGSGGTERARIDSDGRLLVGATTEPDAGDGQYSKLVVQGYTGAPTGAGYMSIARGGAATAGFVAGAEIGRLAFTDSTGASFAYIGVRADADTAASDYPGRLVFATTADGDPSPSPRMTIKADGKVGIGNQAPNYALDVTGSINTYNGFLRIAGTSSPSGNDPHIYRPGTSEIGFWAGGTDRMRIDSSGKLLVGTTLARSNFAGNTASPLVQVEGVTTAKASYSVVRNAADAIGPTFNIGKTRGASVGLNTAVVSGDQCGVITFQGADGTNLLRAAQIEAFVDNGADGTALTGSEMPGRLVFATTADGASSPSPRMTINADGDVLINRTTAEASGSSLQVIGTPAASFEIGINGNNVVEFRKSGGASVVGSISINVAGTATAYNTSSDYRLKENVTPVTDGITRLQQLKPSRFNFIADPDTTVDGFIAHEVQTVVPEAITGEKDAVDDEGNPQYQGIDQSKLVPLLTAALQEAIGEIESLKARVAALESA